MNRVFQSSDQDQPIPPRTGQYQLPLKKLREDKVLLGRILAADPNYPSKAILRQVATTLVG